MSQSLPSESKQTASNHLTTDNVLEGIEADCDVARPNL